MQTNTQNNAERVSAKVNAKRTKTWKIGEYCAGGVIRAKSNGEVIKLEIRDYFTDELLDCATFGRVHEFRIEEFLTRFTTIGYSDIVIKWIKANVWGNK